MQPRHDGVIMHRYDEGSSDYSSKGVDFARKHLRAFFCPLRLLLWRYRGWRSLNIQRFYPGAILIFGIHPLTICKN
jgi:hypothetical protein